MEIEKIKREAEEILQILDYHKKSMTQAQLAPMLGLHPSSISNLKNLLESIVKEINDENDLTVKIEKYNNIANNITDKFDHFLLILRNLKDNKNTSSHLVPSYYEVWKNNIFHTIDNTQQQIIDRGLLGLYDCYTHSSIYEKIVKSPLVIRSNENDGRVEVLQKSVSDDFFGRGVIFLVGGYLITIYMIDVTKKIGVIKETMSIHITLPMRPNPNILKGIWLCLTTNNQPSASRIVLKKVGQPISEKELNKKEFDIVDYQEIESIEIRDYLQDSIESTIRCVPPRNTDVGSMNSLVEEKELIKNRYSDYDNWK